KVIVGVRDHFEIWAADNWMEYVADRESKFDELAERALDKTAAATGNQTAQALVAAPAVPR
ncbi:MAG: hypothetical protein AAF961_03965, partial [Planctomycetota bacterium]